MGTTTRPQLQPTPVGAAAAQSWAKSPIGPLVVFAVLRLPVILTASAPVIVPDETGAWAVGRWLSGMRPLIEMNDMPEYPLVPGLVLAPLQWLPVDAVTQYRLGLVVTSLLVIGAAFLLRSSVAAVSGDRALAAAAFAMTLLFPATFLTTLFTWAEATVLLCVAAFVQGLVSCLYAPRRVARVPILFTALAAGVAPTVHGRLLVLPAVWLALLGWAALRRRGQTPVNEVPRGDLLAAAGVTVIAAFSLSLLDRAAKQAVWTNPRSAEDAVVSGLLDPVSWPAGLQAATGQFWYAAVTSSGLAVVGAFAALRLLLRRSDPSARALCAVLTACGLGVAVISTAFMSQTVGNVGVDQVGRMGGIRWDHLVYGRYLDTMVLLAAIAGVCALAMWTNTWSRRVLGAAAVASLTATLLLRGWWADADLAASIRPTSAGLAVLGPMEDSLPLLGATAMAVVAMVAFAIVVGARREFLFAVLGMLLCIGAVSAAGIGADMHGPGGSQGVQEDLPDPPAGASAAVIPADLNETMPYVLLWPRMQVVAVPRGWHFDFSEVDSTSVAADLPPRAGLVALPTTLGPPPGPGDWAEHWSDDLVTVWIRQG